jgi:predicted nucleic acid-binding protein
MLLADSSAWVEFLRGTRSPTCERLREALQGDEVATTDAVMLEVVGGARTLAERDTLVGMFDSLEYLPQLARDDAVAAADLYRSCRVRGVTVRSWLDCLIATVSIRTAVPVLHLDSDFAAMGRTTDLIEFSR